MGVWQASMRFARAALVRLPSACKFARSAADDGRPLSSLAISTFSCSIARRARALSRALRFLCPVSALTRASSFVICSFDVLSHSSKSWSPTLGVRICGVPSPSSTSPSSNPPLSPSPSFAWREIVTRPAVDGLPSLPWLVGLPSLPWLTGLFLSLPWLVGLPSLPWLMGLSSLQWLTDLPWLLDLLFVLVELVGREPPSRYCPPTALSPPWLSPLPPLSLPISSSSSSCPLVFVSGVGGGMLPPGSTPPPAVANVGASCRLHGLRPASFLLCTASSTMRRALFVRMRSTAFDRIDANRARRSAPTSDAGSKPPPSRVETTGSRGHLLLRLGVQGRSETFCQHAGQPMAGAG